ncbi:MAG: DUF58 domain-containing protein [Planctomycetaceae bacterium]
MSTETSRNVLSPAFIASLQGLQLRVEAVVEGVLAGRHRSTRHGFSVEFAQHRDYVPGDDVRHIDWKLFARRDRHYVRQYEDETRFRLSALLDCSGSMTYRSANSPLSKLEYAATLAAATLWIVQHQQDEAGLCCFDKQADVWLPPGSQSGWMRHMLTSLHGHLEKIVSQRSEHDPTEGGEDTVWQTLHDVADRLPPRTLVMLFSDGFVDVEEFRRVVQHFRYRRQELRLIRVLDPAEISFPFGGLTEFVGLETGDTLSVPADSIKESYLREFADLQRELETTCRGAGFGMRQISTDMPLDAAMRLILQPKEGAAAG